MLLAMDLVELQNTCKKKLNRKMLAQPNICYIFKKLGVQGYQIWHSHVSIPFNSAQQCKKALYVIISVPTSPDNIFGTNCDIMWHLYRFKNPPKMDEYGPKMAKKSTVMQISEKTYLDLKFKNKCGQKTSNFHIDSMS